MHKGYKVIDMDTHIGPNFDVLCEYVDPSLRDRVAEMDQYRQASGRNIASPACRPPAQCINSRDSRMLSTPVVTTRLTSEDSIRPTPDPSNRTTYPNSPNWAR